MKRLIFYILLQIYEVVAAIFWQSTSYFIFWFLFQIQGFKEIRFLSNYFLWSMGQIFHSISEFSGILIS